MESILKADIFFFISSISVVIITLVLLVAGFYFIKIIRNFYKISNILKDYTENANKELRDMGDHVRNSSLFTFLFGREKKKSEQDKRSKKSI
ncbi:MAG: hypothetical protein WDK96_03820 [Candidatus Paceibacterota bacterium]|jgi:hypothetical protein